MPVWKNVTPIGVKSKKVVNTVVIWSARHKENHTMKILTLFLVLIKGYIMSQISPFLGTINMTMRVSLKIFKVINHTNSLSYPDAIYWNQQVTPVSYIDFRLPTKIIMLESFSFYCWHIHSYSHINCTMEETRSLRVHETVGDNVIT